MGDKTEIAWTDVLQKRFWSYVKIGEPTECWPWLAGCFDNGYGQFRLGKRKVKAHRCAYELTKGALPTGLLGCHSCDNRPCCNPAHVFPGTNADNAHDRDKKGRTSKDHSPRLPGELNPSAILKRRQVEGIRCRVARGERRKSLASEFGVSYSTINAIMQGKTWQ
jgi:hypothetical protein